MIGPLYHPKNYPPINQIFIPTRLMEKTVEDPPIAFLTSDFIGESKHGLLILRFCISWYFDFLDLVTLNVDKKKTITMIFLGMTKAFDRVPHGRLLLNIKSFGLANLLYFWLTSCFSEPSQAVSANRIPANSWRCNTGWVPRLLAISAPCNRDVLRTKATVHLCYVPATSR